MGSTGFARGSRAWGHCQRCGFRYLLSQLVHDGQIQGLQVCDDCWDPKHPQEALPSLLDPMALKHATGDMDAASAGGVPPAPSIAWSAASISGDGSTATLAYANANLLSVDWVGESSGMVFSFDGATLTLLAGDAEPGVTTGTIRAVAVDALGREIADDLSVEITVVQPEPTFNASYDVGFYSFPASDVVVRLQLDANGSLYFSQQAGNSVPMEVVLDSVQQPTWNEGFQPGGSLTIPGGAVVDGTLYTLAIGSIDGPPDAILEGFFEESSGTILFNAGQGNFWDGFTGTSSGVKDLLVEVRRISDNVVVATTTLNLFFSESSFGGYT